MNWLQSKLPSCMLVLTVWMGLHPANIQAGEVMSFTLVNASSNADITTLADAASIDLATTGSDLNIRADISGTANKVNFSLSGAMSHTQSEGVAPYALYGDNSGDYNSWTPVVGSYTLSANCDGVGALSVNFSVTDGETPPSPPPDGDDGDGTITIGGTLKQWHRVDLKQAAKYSTEMASPNPFRNYRFNVTFTAPGGKVYLVPGYFATDGNGGDAGNVWMAHLNPHETGEWTYAVSFRSGTDVAVSLDSSAGTAVSPFDGKTGTFTVGASDKIGADFRAADKGMLVNRGDHYLTYGGSGKPFLFTGPGIPENILGYRGFTNTTVGDGHIFAIHGQHWNTGDPDWNNGDGKNLIGALNYIADQGGNSLYMMSNTIGGDGNDCFPHPTTTTTRDRYDLLKLKQWDIALGHAQSKGIYLHWCLAENETSNYTYYGGSSTSGSLTIERKLYFRILNAVFGHHNALKWNLMEECEFDAGERRAQMQYIHAIDPYDHPVTYQVGGAGIAYSTMDSHLGETTFDAASFQGGASRSDMFNTIKSWRETSAGAGEPWACAWDEPQKIENDNADEVNGYPMGRRDKMWPCLMGGGDGFMWYIQQDGGGHGFDQTIEDLTIMQNAFNWSGYARDFLGDLPLLQMTPSMSIVNSITGYDYTLYKTGDVYAIYNDRVGTGMTLDLSGVSGTFTVKWFDPRNGGALQNGSVTTITGGVDNVDLGTAPGSYTEDWVILVQRPKRIAYIHGDVSEAGDVPSGAEVPYDQMLLTDTGNKGLSIFKAMVEAEGCQIEQHYDADTKLDAAFLDQFGVVIFGLHQKEWSSSEKSALDAWLRNGGGMLIYSDSAAGGKYSIVGAQNTVGQTVVNNLISQYGMEVTVDQANGVKQAGAGAGATHPIVTGDVALEGEGVSPVAVDPAANAIRLIPYEGEPIPYQQNITITDPQFAALALARVGEGNVIAMFDRQPMWNDGPGSDIERQDNMEILRRVINWLSGATASSGANAVINASPLSGSAPLLVEFDGSGSTPSAGTTILGYDWDFDNDGTTDASGANVSHSYTAEGNHTAKLTVTDSLGATDSATVTITVAAQDPFGNVGNPWPVPGRIEAEDFDTGGEGIAYHDTDVGNNGDNNCRSGENVDLQDSSGTDPGDVNVGWTEDGEWLEYTVNVTESGTYSLDLRVASQSAGGTVRIICDNQDKTGQFSLPVTGAWQTYTTVASPEFTLISGQQTVRIEMPGGGFNLNWFEFKRATQTFAEFMESYPSLTGDDALREADPDDDGISNIMEQWMGTNPTVMNARGPLDINANGNQLHIQFTYDSSVAGSELVYKTSEDLHSWIPKTIDPEWIAQNGDLREIDAAYDLSETPDNFHRLEVSW